MCSPGRGCGPWIAVGVPIHLSATPGGIQGPRPTPGQHNREIFGELGYSDAEIAAFAGRVADAPDGRVS